MPFGPAYSSLPSTVIGGVAVKFINETAYNQLLGNFSTLAGDVNAAEHNISNVGGIAAEVLVLSSHMSISSAFPLAQWYDSDGPSNAKFWELVANMSQFVGR